MTSGPSLAFPSSSPQALQTVIARIESGGNPRALRFEPRVYAENVAPATSARIADVHGCDYETGRIIAATSWGLFQIMGFNLWSGPHAYDSSVFAFCVDVAEQRAFFQTFLSDHGQDFTLAELLGDEHKLLAFATFYNGDGPLYASAMRRAAGALGYAA